MFIAEVDSRIVDVRNDLNETSVEIRDNGKHSITLAMEIFDPSTGRPGTLLQ